MALPKLDIPLAELYPDGRKFYCEDDDSAAFIELAHGLGLWPVMNYPPPDAELEPFMTVEVPPEKLDAFYAVLDNPERTMRVGT